MVVTPMFPLGTVLVPGMVLPLHVFEPRYRRMLDDCMGDGGDQSFGVVLIERGSEVGGGDVRTSIGTLARIAQAEQAPDGRWALVAVGTRRIRVDRWLADDPYPRAEVSDWPDEGDGDGNAVPGAGAVPGTVVPLLRRAAALARELGMMAAPLDLELSDDAVTAGYQAIVAAPLGPADRQSLLAAPTLANRWTLLDTLLTDQIQLLEAELAHGGG